MKQKRTRASAFCTAVCVHSLEESVLKCGRAGRRGAEVEISVTIVLTLSENVSALFNAIIQEDDWRVYIKMCNLVVENVKFPENGYYRHLADNQILVCRAISTENVGTATN